jgi:hypothetical protein
VQGTAVKKAAKFIRDNSLSIVLFSLFVVFLAAQSISGCFFFNEQRASHGFDEIDYVQFLSSGTFLNGIFSNWQAAILQLASLIIFGVFLVQRGATHSHKHLAPRPKGHQKKGRLGGEGSWLYRNSLFMAFLALFIASFILHVFSGAAAFNDQRTLSHQPPLSVAAYFISAKFWFLTTETWQAEYLAIGLYMILSIYLRQKGSPESKPVDSSNEETGESQHE